MQNKIVQNVQKKVFDDIRTCQMLSPGDGVVAGVSGGADSVCLLHFLVQLREQWNLTIRAVHVHHGLRGAEADRDAAYTEELSRAWGVPCVVVHVNVTEYAGKHGLSLEEAGRILRYQALKDQAEEMEAVMAAHAVMQPEAGKESGNRFDGQHAAVKIAVAHHQDDQAETILHNLFRGSGLKGLGGMSPTRGQIIRPLLSCSRKEILAWLSAHQIAYCQDSTNDETHYTRNKLRHLVLPLIQQEINGNAAEHIRNTGSLAAEADEYLREQAQVWLLGEQIRESGRIGVMADHLLLQKKILQKYILFEMLETMAEGRRDLSSVHLESVLELLTKEVGARCDLPYALTARKSYQELWIEKKTKDIFVDNPTPEEIPKLEMKVFSYEKHQEIPQNRYTKWLDYDRIKGTLSVRFRQTGDYITLKDGKKKTIKSFMIDEKIPREERDHVLLLAEGSHVLWIVGYRLSEYYKVSDHTKQILQVQFDGGRNHGR